MVEVMANDTAEWMLVTLWMAERARGWDGIDRELMKGLAEGVTDGQDSSKLPSGDAEWTELKGLQVGDGDLPQNKLVA